MRLNAAIAALSISICAAACGRQMASTEDASGVGGNDAGSIGRGGAGGASTGAGGSGGSDGQAGAGGAAATGGVGATGGAGGGNAGSGGSSFACGPGRCSIGQTFCEAWVGSTMQPDMYWCVNPPAACPSNPTCACICPPSNPNACYSCVCSEENGAVTLTCYADA